MPGVLSKEEKEDAPSSPPWGIIAAVGLAAVAIGGIFIATSSSGEAKVATVVEAPVKAAPVKASPAKPAPAAAVSVAPPPAPAAAPAAAAAELPAAPVPPPAAPAAPTDAELANERVSEACRKGKSLSDTATMHFKSGAYDEAIKSWTAGLEAYVQGVPAGHSKRAKALQEARVIRWNLSSTQRRLALATKDSDPAAHRVAVEAVEKLCTEALLDTPRYLRFVERRATFRLMRANYEDEGTSLALIRSASSDLESLAFLKQLAINTSPASKTMDLDAIATKISEIFDDLTERTTNFLFAQNEREAAEKFDLPAACAVEYFMTQFVTEANFAQCATGRTEELSVGSISRAAREDELSANAAGASTFEQQLAQEAEVRSVVKNPDVLRVLPFISCESLSQLCDALPLPSLTP